jgi:hypothetical protein
VSEASDTTAVVESQAQAAGRRDHVSRLAGVGIDARAAEGTGQLDLRNWEDAYFRDGHFDQHGLASATPRCVKTSAP